MVYTVELQMMESQDGRKNILEHKQFQPTAPFFFLAKLSKYETCTPRDMFILQLTKGKAIVSETTLLQESESKCKYLKGNEEKVYGMDTCFILLHSCAHNTLPLFKIKHFLFEDFTHPNFYIVLEGYIQSTLAIEIGM